ncbi:MAG: hypothetical protein LBL35_05515 [Clostridiales bacterium]|nr:hypothetical protein [Clostridiales bacterium]
MRVIKVLISAALCVSVIAAFTINRDKKNVKILWGEIKPDMVSVKANASVLINEPKVRELGVKPFVIRLPNNYHGMLFFPITFNDVSSDDIAITTTLPMYIWSCAKPSMSPISANTLEANAASEVKSYDGDAKSLDELKYNVRCLIKGNSLFLDYMDSFELWYFPTDSDN